MQRTHASPFRALSSRAGSSRAVAASLILAATAFGGLVACEADYVPPSREQRKPAAEEPEPAQAPKPTPLVDNVGSSEAAAKPTPPFVPDGFFLVTVADKAKGQPLVGAEIRSFPMRVIDPLALTSKGVGNPKSEVQDDIEILAWFGEVATTNEKGEALLPYWDAPGRLTLTARHGNLFDQRNLKKDGKKFVDINARERGTVIVDLVDESGLPLNDGGVVVQRIGAYDFEEITSAPVRDNGTAVLDFLDRFKNRYEPSDTFAIAQLGLFNEPVARPIQIPGSPKRLELPGQPVGSLELAFKGANDQPVFGLMEVELSIKDAAENASRPVIVQTDSGVVRFDHVGLGLTLDVQARRPGGDSVGELEVVGPTEAGQVVQAEFDAELTGLTITGRLLWPDGTPLVREGVTYEFTRRSFFDAGVTRDLVRTRPDGTFQLFKPHASTQVRWDEVIVDLSWQHLDGGPVYTYSWSKTDVPIGLENLGDIVLEEQPVEDGDE
ncbi:MAG: hypothetical protein ACYS26_02735 [Planctomycetota bacterium]|jgi:hypothetical protein